VRAMQRLHAAHRNTTSRRGRYPDSQCGLGPMPTPSHVPGRTQDHSGLWRHTLCLPLRGQCRLFTCFPFTPGDTGRLQQCATLQCPGNMVKLGAVILGTMIVYLHGLNSAGSSHKAAVLREQLASIDVFSPTYPAQAAAQALTSLTAQLGELLETSATDTPRVLVGSSMGGFYGAWLAHRLGFDHLVMINPALRPWELLQQVEGWQYNEAKDERYYLSAEMVAATGAFATTPSEIGLPVTLLHDKGDELIDYRQAVAAYDGFADIHLFEGGSHAFEHMDEAVTIIAGIHRSLAAEE
jgi:uncharacterized protein